jgi:glycosyltransferase involved in cell wall biosynthesis
MKIVYIIPGSGGTFYCQNCMRDNEMVLQLRAMGHDVIMVPMYLPLNENTLKTRGDTPVFYGAINIYLKQMFPGYRRAPVWLEKLLDSRPLLKVAAHLSGSTSAKGLEEMTLSMLQGEEGKQASELEHLVHWLEHEGKPDIIHLSNALLLGLAKSLKQRLQTRIVCTLQDEHQWVDPMDAPYQQRLWNLMAEKSRDISGFITVSRFYAEFMQQKLGLSAQRIAVVPMGIDVQGYQTAPLTMNPPVIGYLNRFSEMFGVETLIDAFILLKKRWPDLQLHLTGGHTAEDKPFIQRMQKKLNTAGLLSSVRMHRLFNKSERIAFLSGLSVLSVPVPYGEAFGTYVLEALAAGVPVVQPEAASFPEVIERTGGGLLCKPQDPESLADKIHELLSNPERARSLGRQGQKVIQAEYTIQKMAERMIVAYEHIMDDRNEP